MAVPNWPSTLPNELLQRGYSHETADALLRSSMEVGPSKVRRRHTAGVENVTGNMLLTEAQLGVLRSFFDVTLKYGALRFSASDPVSLVAREFRFTAPIKWTMISGFYDVTFEFEILP